MKLLTRKAKYDDISKTYDYTRKADPLIAEELVHLIKTRPPANIIDLGCGTGNYAAHFYKLGFNVDGVDISSKMLAKAKDKISMIRWHQNDVRDLPFESNKFHGAISVLATHHFANLDDAFSEAYRILKSGSRFVIFTSSPSQVNNYWLNNYFPDTISESARSMMEFEEISQLLQSKGFKNVNKKLYFVNNELQDMFLNSGKYRPELYLDPKFRAGISSFSFTKNNDEIKKGLFELEQDINTGNIETVIEKYENKLGDCMFVYAEK